MGRQIGIYLCQFRENIRNKLTHLMLWKTAIYKTQLNIYKGEYYLFALILNNRDKFELNAFHTSLRHIFGTGMNVYSYLISFLYVPGHATPFMQSLQRFRLGLFGGILFGKSLPSPLSTRFPTIRDILFCMLLLSPLTDLCFTYGTTRNFTNSHPKPILIIEKKKTHWVDFSWIFITVHEPNCWSIYLTGIKDVGKNRYSPATAIWFSRVKLGSLVDYICSPLREIILFIDLRLLLTIILSDCIDRFQGRQKKNVTQSCRFCFYYIAVKCHSYIISIPKNLIWKLLFAGGFHKFFGRPFLLETSSNCCDIFFQ